MHKIETVENRVREIFNDHILEPEQITGEELFSKVNSVDYIKIIVAIELEYDFEFNDDDLSIGRFKTITESYILTRQTIMGKHMAILKKFWAKFFARSLKERVTK